MLWKTTENGIELRRIDISTGAEANGAIAVEDVAAVLEFDDVAGRVIARMSNGDLAILSIGDTLELVHQFEGITAPVAFDALRNLMLTIDQASNQLVVFDTLDFSETMRGPAVAGTVTALRLADNGNRAVIVSETEIINLRLDIPTFAPASVDGISPETEVRFGLKIEADNSPPQATSELAFSLDEDAIASIADLKTVANVSDINDDTLAFLLKTAPSNGVVTVDPSGAFTYTPAENYFGTDQFVMLVHDGRSVSDAIMVNLTIDPKPDPATGANVNQPFPLPENVVAGTTVGTIIVQSPDPFGNFQIFIKDQRFLLQDQLIVVAPDAVFDFENEPVVAVEVEIVRVGDPSQTITETVEVSIGNISEPVTDLLPSSVSVAEATPGAEVAILQPVDGDASGVYSYTVTELFSELQRFEVVNGVLKLRDGIEVDFENESRILIELTVVDADFPGDTITRSLFVDVTNVNENPIRVSLSNLAVKERLEGVEIGNLAALDFDDGDSHTFTIDDDRFEAVDKLLKLKSGSSVSIDEDGSIILIMITATDAGGLTATTSFDIALQANFRPFHNAAEPMDVDGNGMIEPIDALAIINILNANGPGPLTGANTVNGAYIDVNGDGFLTPLDALLIINYLNSQTTEQSGPEPQSEPDLPEASPNNAPSEDQQRFANDRLLPGSYNSVVDLIFGDDEDEDSDDELLDAMTPIALT